MPVFAALGASILTSSVIGMTATASLGFAVGSFAVGVLATAAVGAAIGGITAAVTGGDIGKGMLVGAVGTVAAVGIASGIGAAMGGSGTFGMATLGETVSGTVPTSGLGMAAEGAGAGGYMTQHVPGAAGAIPAAAPAGPTSTGFFGMNSDTIAGQLFGAGLEGVKSFFADDPDVDWRTTEEGVRFQAGADLERQRVASSASRSSTASTPWANTKEGAMWLKDEDFKLAKEQAAWNIEGMQAEYAEKGALEEESYDRANRKFKTSAGLASALTFGQGDLSGYATAGGQAAIPGPHQAEQEEGM